MSTTWRVASDTSPSPPAPHWPGGSCPSPGRRGAGSSPSRWSQVPHCGWWMGGDASWCPQTCSSLMPLPLPGFPPPRPCDSQKGAQKIKKKKKKLKRETQFSRLLPKSITQSLKLSILCWVEATPFSQAVAITVKTPGVSGHEGRFRHPGMYLLGRGHPALLCRPMSPARVFRPLQW